MKVVIVGGGLSGCEAAYQCLLRSRNRNLRVVIKEMRPLCQTPAHQTGHLAEAVCSNSLKSVSLENAHGLLKHEMSQCESLIVKAALHARVPAGQALAFEREKLSQYVEKTLSEFERFSLQREEVTVIPSEAELRERNEVWIVATGPLTSDPLAAELVRLSGGEKRLFFYDAIAPIISKDSIDLTCGFWEGRYGKQDPDYFNIPLNEMEYKSLIAEILKAEMMPLAEFESTQYFEGCLPIEVMAERGEDTLRFGPMKPVGFLDHRTQKRPYAVIQLRQENMHGTMLGMVGFQTKMKWGEQKRIFGEKIPGFANAEFLRFGSIHRNTYVESPKVLSPDLSFRANQRVFLAGQLTGVEGYSESSAMGIVAAFGVLAKLFDKTFVQPPEDTMLGALHHYVTHDFKGREGSSAKGFQFSPMNANFGLLSEVKTQHKKTPKDVKKQLQSERAQQLMKSYTQSFVNTLQ